MGFLYMAGKRFNLVGRGPEPLTAAGNVNSLFPLANLGTYRPREPFSFSQSIPNMRIIVDGQLLEEGSFETFAAWADASSGGGAATQSGDDAQTGTSSLKLVPGASGEAGVLQDVTVRSGERLRLQAFIRQDGAGDVAFRVYNRQTGRFLDASGAWGAFGPSGVGTAGDTSAAFVQVGQTFQVESLEACGGLDTIVLAVWPYSVDDLTAYVDDVELFPAINFLGIFGHNLQPILTPTWRSDDNSGFSSPTTHATPALRRPSFYAYLSSPVYARHWDFLLAGGPQAFGGEQYGSEGYPRIGELVMSYAEMLTRGPDRTWSDPREKRQSRIETPEGDQHILPRGPYELRAPSIPFTHFAEADRAELLEGLIGRSRHGELPSVIVPSSTAQQVLFCRVEKAVDLSRRHNDLWSGLALKVREMPHMDWIDG